MITPLIVALVLALAYFFSETYFRHLRKKSVEIISFSAGLLISFVFITMFPKVIEGYALIRENVLFIALWGFIIFHIIEKHVFQHTKNENERSKKIDHVRSLGFFVNHVILGFALVFFFRDGGMASGFIFAVPILIHLINSALLMEATHKRIHESTMQKIFASSSIFLGALLGTFIPISTLIYLALFSFATGMFLYLVVRDVIPKYAKGKVTYFLIGVIIYFIIILFEKFLVGV